MEYRPTRAWLVANGFSTSMLVLLGLGLAFLVPSFGAWLALGAAAAIAIGSVGLIRLPRLRIRYDSKNLTIIGALWSRVIPRSQIIAVDPEPHFAWVTWRTVGGRKITTPLTVLWGNQYAWLPDGAAKRGREYLRRVRRWARDVR